MMRRSRSTTRMPSCVASSVASSSAMVASRVCRSATEVLGDSMTFETGSGLRGFDVQTLTLLNEMHQQVRRLAGVAKNAARRGGDDRTLYFVGRGVGTGLQIQRGDAGDDRRRVGIAVGGERRRV